ncbi:DUF3726 domain-containing protein [Alkalicoccus chagannorensis]|uniref:DUF3726 domain-containing protein n=1 Tax=Alkalicoccus chagannorensis TaxID=427072 RepID=UPI000426219F|nr:DUF3726 domain-containing protein [Alkalicoccus chagannorensis]
MWVTQPELISHIKKVMEACRVPSGCIDDAAELAAWGEIMGLGGLKDVYAHLSRLEQSSSPLLHHVAHHTLDGNKNSALIISRLIFDELMCSASVSHGEPVALTRCLPSMSMMENVSRAAKKGYQAEIYIPGAYPEVHVMTALHQDDIRAFTLRLSEVNKHLFQRGVSSLLNMAENNQETQTRIQHLNAKAPALFLTSKDMKLKQRKADDKGINVDRWLWNVLGEKGNQSLV